jgi:hypothetical protein
MNKFLVLALFFVLFSESIIAQKKTFEFFVNPFIQKFGNLDKQYTITSSPHFDVDYQKLPSFNFGAALHCREKETQYFSVGLFHQTNFYQMKMTVFSPDSQPKRSSRYNEFRKISTQNIGFNLFYSKQVLTNLTICGGFSFLFPYYTKSNLENVNKTSTGIGGFIGSQYYTYRFDYTITQKKFLPQIFIPEITLKTKISEKLSFNLGAQLQFFEIYKPGLINICANGFIGKDNSDTYEQIYKSRLKNTNLNFYFGLTYNLR